MKIAIHPRPGSFSERWIKYCKQKGIEYETVDAYSPDIVRRLLRGGEFDAFMWHYNHADYRDMLFARQLFAALEQGGGLALFPDCRTGWHFDDKVGQKYLLETIGAPLVGTYVFYSKADALEWVRNADYPKVFKLRGGAGSSNVRLVRSRREAERLVRRAFGRGFAYYNRLGQLTERIRRYRSGKGGPVDILKGVYRALVPPASMRLHPREKGYAYFQDFVPGNDCDIRVVVTGDKAFAIKRLVRKGDFRASGSGSIVYDRTAIDERCVKVAFDINRRLRSRSAALDFVMQDGSPVAVEVGFGYSMHVYDPCPGYWDSEMKWHEGPFDPQAWQVEEVLKQAEAKRGGRNETVVEAAQVSGR